MKILALETSSITASAAIISDKCLTAEYTMNHKKTHSQTLLPMIDEICKMTENNVNTLDAIAISEGPGSFTGLRIGCSTAKGLGLALDIPLISVPTLSAMAYNMYGYRGIICPMIDARRKNVYTGLYEFVYNEVNNTCILEEELQEVLPQCLLSIEELMDKINEFDREVIFIGDGVDNAIEVINQKIKVPYIIAPPHMSSQRASSVAMYAERLFKQGKAINARELLPEYLRPSQAERELCDKINE